MSDTVLLEKIDRVVVLTLNRPDALNALNSQLLSVLRGYLVELNNDPDIGCIVLAGSDKAFAAGADIKEMADKSCTDMFMTDHFGDANSLKSRVPIIGAVSGYALGGGCELAMMCDIIFASETAQFGQPEIKLGIMPGMGGSQRMTRAIGKAKAMDMVLTGRMMDAEEAERSGLVARIFPIADLLEEAKKAAKKLHLIQNHLFMLQKKLLNEPLRPHWKKVCATSNVSFIRFLPQKIRKKGWLHFWKSGNLILNINSYSIYCIENAHRFLIWVYLSLHDIV